MEQNSEKSMDDREESVEPLNKLACLDISDRMREASSEVRFFEKEFEDELHDEAAKVIKLLHDDNPDETVKIMAVNVCSDLDHLNPDINMEVSLDYPDSLENEKISDMQSREEGDLIDESIDGDDQSSEKNKSISADVLIGSEETQAVINDIKTVESQISGDDIHSVESDLPLTKYLEISACEDTIKQSSSEESTAVINDNICMETQEIMTEILHCESTMTDHVDPNDEENVTLDNQSFAESRDTGTDINREQIKGVDLISEQAEVDMTDIQNSSAERKYPSVQADKTDEEDESIINKSVGSDGAGVPINSLEVEADLTDINISRDEVTAPDYQSCADISAMTQSVTENSGSNISDCSLESGGSSLSVTAQPTVSSDEVPEALNADKDVITRNKKCPDISTLDDDVQILRDSCTEDVENNCYLDAAATSNIDMNAEFKHSHGIGNISRHGDLLIEGREVVDAGIGVYSCDQEIAESLIDTVLDKTGTMTKDKDPAGDSEGWGDEIILDNLELDETFVEPNVLKEGSGVKENCELLHWLEIKETECNKMLSADQQLQHTKDAVEIEKRDDVEVSIEAEILKHLTEKVLFPKSDDGRTESISEPLEGIGELDALNPTEEHVLDSNCVMITPMVVSPKAKRKKGTKTPKTERKTIKSPLLRRKEIRTCISLHNECETSDVLEELMRPAIDYGSNTNIVDAVEDTQERASIQADPTKVDDEQHKKEIATVRSVMI